MPWEPNSATVCILAGSCRPGAPAAVCRLSIELWQALGASCNRPEAARCPGATPAIPARPDKRRAPGQRPLTGAHTHLGSSETAAGGLGHSESRRGPPPKPILRSAAFRSTIDCSLFVCPAQTLHLLMLKGRAAWPPPVLVPCRQAAPPPPPAPNAWPARSHRAAIVQGQA